jgi:Tfp pilus assembly protein PilF
MKRTIYIGLLGLLLCACGSTRMLPRQAQGDYYYMEGLRGYHSGNYAYARDCFKAVLKTQPQHDAALYYMGNMYYHAGDLDKALEYMTAAAEADVSNYWYQLQVAQCYLGLYESEKARSVYESLLERYPQKTDLYYDLANIYMTQRDSEKALELLGKIETLGGMTEATGFYRFSILMMQQKRDEAQALAEFLAEHHGSPRFFAILGDLYAESGRDSLALDNYDKAFAMDPGYMPAVYGQAEVYRMRQHFDSYFEKMRLFMRSNEVMAGMKVDYMEQLMQNRNFVGMFLQQVDTLFVNIRASHPQDSGVAYIYTSFLAQSGRQDAAVALLKENVSHYPKDKSVWMQYLVFLYYLQDWDSLGEAAKEAGEIFPKHADIMSMEGLALWQRQQLSEATRTFEAVIPLAAKDSSTLLQTYSFLGDLYHERGDASKSYKAYENALKINPKQAVVLNNYAYYLSLEGKKLDKAYDMSKKAIDLEPESSTYLDTFGWILYKMGKYQEAKAVFKRVLVLGATELNAEVIDHYAEVLFALKDYDMAFIYWNQAKDKDKENKLQLEQKIAERRTQISR